MTPRQREVAGLVAQGLTNDEIAERLYVGHDAVKHMIGRIYQRMEYPARRKSVNRVSLALDYWKDVANGS